MNSLIYGVVFFAVLICIVEGSGQNISCYQCNSGSQYNGAKCGDPFDAKAEIDFLIPCGPEYTMCRKMTQNVEGDYRVIRSCATSGRKNQCYGRTGTANIKLEYCECDSSECNSAPSIFPALSLSLSVVAALLLALLAH